MAGKLYLDTQVACYTNTNLGLGVESGKINPYLLAEEIKDVEQDIEKVKRKFAMLAAANPRVVNEEGDFGGQVFQWEDHIEYQMQSGFEELEELYYKLFALREFKDNIDNVRIDL